MDTVATIENEQLTVLPADSLVPEVIPDVPDTLREEMIAKIQEDWTDIIAAQADLAKGLWVKEFVKDPKTGKTIMGPDGRPTTKVYMRKPDKDAGQYLMNQVIGKPKETQVVEGKVNFILDI